MYKTETGRLCQNVEHATAQIRTSIGDRTGISEILDRFWLLQDSLSRLIQSAADHERGNMTQCRSVIRKVLSILESPQARKQSSISGVRLACEAINSSLIRLEQVMQQAQAAGAAG